MTTLPQAVPPRSGPKGHLRNFWMRVSDGMAASQLWSQAVRDARSSYRFYSAGLEDVQPGRSRWRRWWQIAKALFWAILEKLTPARRILLLLGLVLLIAPANDKFDSHIWGGLVILIVLLLELADRVIMKRDLEIAKDIQAWLLPGAPLQIPGYKLAYATRPANTVAGDYYDVILRPGNASQGSSGGASGASGSNDGRILFVVADVVGKSMPAAMLMATFQASLRTLSTSGIALTDLVAGTNRYACSNSQGGVRFTTAFFAELDPATGEVVYLNAGHNAPILRKKTGVAERLDTGGIPIGIFAESKYQVGKTRLESGDWLVVFTDGVVEAVDQKDEEYGETALMRIVNREPDSSPAELLGSLFSDLDRYVGNTQQQDDITCLLLKRT
jgi:sigma-B regulation protein RsbU (phosphoserine phosphatase)